MLVVACAHFNRVGISVVGTERIIKEYQFKPDAMGDVYSAFLWMYTLAMLPGGMLAARFGARRARMRLVFGSTVFVALTGCVGLIGAGAATVWLGLVVVRGLLGMVNAPLHPGSARMVYDCVPAESRSLANGLVTAAACVGIASTYYVMGALIDRFGWQFALVITSGLTLVVALVWTFATDASDGAGDRDVPDRPSPLAGLTSVLSNRSVIAITLSYGAFDYFQYLFFYWSQYYFETIRHESASTARGYSTVITLTMGAGMISGGWLADHAPRSFSPWWRRAAVPVLGMIGSGVVFELGLLGTSAQATLAALAVSAALVGACEASFWTTVVRIGRPFGGTAAGLMNTGANLGGAVALQITPRMGEYFAKQYGTDAGWRLSLAVAGIIAIIGGVMWWWVDPADRLSNSETETEMEGGLQ